MSELIGKVCPFCKTEFKEDDIIKICPACNISHHQECWNENKGCSTFGCSEQNYEPQGTNITDVCVSCGMALGDGQMFCPKCGTPKIEVKESICSACGSEMTDGQHFCPKCGQKVGLAVDNNVASSINKFNSGVVNKKNKSKVLPIILVVVLLICGIAGYFVYSTMQAANKEKAIATYVDNAKSFQLNVLASASKMETIGNEIQSNWHTYIYDNGDYSWNKTFDSIEDAVYSAQKDQSTNISAVESNKSSLDLLYTDLLKLPDGSDSELSQLKTAVQDLYDEYTNMYDCVMDVTGNYTTFTSNFNECDSAVSKRLNTLTNLLKAYE